jgi:YVTN family beta-propeller protein
MSLEKKESAMKFPAVMFRILSLMLFLAAVPVAGRAQDYKVYVTFPAANNIAVIDGLTDAAVNTISVPPGTGVGPFSVALTPDAKFAYILNGQGCNNGASYVYPGVGAGVAQGFVWVLDTVSNTSLATIPVGLCPQEIAITPDGTRAYVTNVGDGTFSTASLSVIDTATNSVVQTVSLPDIPVGLAITPDGSGVYVATGLTVSVVSTSTNTVVADIPTASPTGFLAEVAITPNGQQAYVTDSNNATVYVISTQTNTVVSSFPANTFPSPWGLAVTPDGSKVYVASYSVQFPFSGYVGFGGTFVIDTATQSFVSHPLCRFDIFTPSACNFVGNFGQTGSSPIFVEITPDGTTAYFSADSANLTTPITGELMVFDTAKNISTASPLFGTVPAGIAISPANNTPTGTNVLVNPVDRMTKASPVTLNFSNVTQAGFTTLLISSKGPTPPNGVQIGNPPLYYNLATTAGFSGGTVVCINYSGVNFGGSTVALNEYQNGAWVDVTASVDTVSQVVCGGVTVLGTFAIFGGGSTGGSPAATTTALASANNPSTYGGTVTFTATVTTSLAGAGTPTGIVNFADGTTALGSVALTNGQAVLTLSSLAARNHSVTATYVGTSSFGGSASPPLTEIVNPAPTSVALSSSANPSTYGQMITLTAIVSANVTGMTGTVSFMSGASVSGQATVAGGVATITVKSANVGSYSFTAAYSGDTDFASGTSQPLVQLVKQQPTTCSVSYVDITNPNLAVPNPFDLANIDVQVLGSAAGLITSLLGATTTVSDNGTALTQLPVSGGSTVQFAIGQDVFTPGTHTYAGSYSGDSNNLPSQCTLTLTVAKAKTSLTLTSSSAPSVQGQTVVFTAKVTTTPGFVPSGGVIFSDGGTQLAIVQFDPTGTAMFSSSSLGPGVHAITANYAGDQNFLGSSGNLTQTVTSSGGGGGGGTCACTKTGNYVDPVPGFVPTSGVEISAGVFDSPNAKYQLIVAIDNANQKTTLGVSLTGTSTQILPITTFPITANWGFSPDSDRLLISFLDNVGQSDELKELYIYDLTVIPARVVAHIASSNGGSSSIFSPSGRYFVYTQLFGASQAQTQIYRVQGVTSQALVFDSGVYSFAVGSGTDLQAGTSGFGPDSPETSFIYSFVTGQTTFQWNLVNLLAGSQVANVSYNTTQARWQYSPCADVVGVGWQLTSTQTQVDLYDASTGKTLRGSGTAIPALGAQLVAIPSGQEVVYLSNGQNQTALLSPPTCGQPNTPMGSNVNVTPRDAGSATSPVSVTFASVTQAGQTSVTVGNTGSAPPANFQLGNPPTYYDLTTTATFSGGTVVCIHYGGITFNNPSAIKLNHFENGAWVDRTTSVNTATQTVCGTVTSFSPFALFEPQGPVAANILPTAGTPQTANIFGAYQTGLRATVTDSADNPVSGVIVTFTAPAVGATGIFAGSGVLASVTTDSSGVASAPPFTANGTVGSYTVSATVNGLSTAANFLLTNSPAATTVTVASLVSSPAYGSPLTFTATVATPVGTPTGTVTFSDAGNSLGASPLNGVTATLIVPSLLAGVHSITASYSGNNSFSGSASTVLTITVSPAPLVIAANNARRPYGANNPAFTGTVTGLLNSDSISASFGSSASPASLVGTYPIVPAVIGAPNVLSNYAIQPVNGALTVAPETTSLTIALSPLSIPVGQSTTATVTLTAPDMVIPINPAVLAPITVTSPVTSDILSNNGVCTLVPGATPGVASCVVAMTSVEPNGRTLNATFAGSADLTTSSSTANLIVTAALNSQQVCIASDFRNVAVPGGSTIWLNSIFKVRDVTKQLIHVTFYQAHVQFQYTDASGNLVNVNQPLPDANITIDPSTAVASTVFDSVNNVWVTTIPWDLDDNTFLTGMPWVVPSAGLPADVEPVAVCGTFASDVANIDIGWRWAAAAYSSFGSDNNVLGVKPVDTDHDNQALNHDRAGTPENYKQFVIPGARGKAGKNFIGSYSGSAVIE